MKKMTFRLGALYDEAAIAAVEKFRQDHDLVYSGNPRGLVDRRLVETLRQAYYGRDRMDSE